MPRICRSILCMVVAIAAWAMATTAVRAQIVEPPPKLKAAVEFAQQEGALLYKLDQAVWAASDAARNVEGFVGDPRIRGWLTEETGQGIRVTFYGGKNRTDFLALYRALLSPNGLLTERPVALGEGEPLTELERSQAVARDKAITIRVAPCARSYNSIAVLRETPKGRSWSFYLLPGTDQANVIMAGIAYRVDVDWQGKKILDKREFSNSCIEIPNEVASKGEEPVGAFLTHLLDPTPTPIHVFLSLQHHQPIAVATTKNSLGWMVTEGLILQLDLTGAK